jgi:hypothetical protein
MRILDLSFDAEHPHYSPLGEIVKSSLPTVFGDGRLIRPVAFATTGNRQPARNAFNAVLSSFGRTTGRRLARSTYT